MLIIVKDVKSHKFEGSCVTVKKFMALACAVVLAIMALAACGCDSATDATEVEATDVTEATDATELA